MNNRCTMSIRRQVTVQHLQGNVTQMSMVKSTAMIIRGRQKLFGLQVQTTKNWWNRLKFSCQSCQVKTLNFQDFSSRGTNRTAMLCRYCHLFYILLHIQSFLSLSQSVYHRSCHCPLLQDTSRCPNAPTSHLESQMQQRACSLAGFPTINTCSCVCWNPTYSQPNTKSHRFGAYVIGLEDLGILRPN